MTHSGVAVIAVSCSATCTDLAQILRMRGIHSSDLLYDFAAGHIGPEITVEKFEKESRAAQ
jgi:hypothetical protein